MGNYIKEKNGVEYMLLNKIPIVSFFTGGGFLDIGFEDAGFETVFTNEFDPCFAELYASGMSSLRNNIDYKITSIESLTKLSPSYIEEKAFPYGKPLLWGIIGGPPCQDFTMNGKRTGFDGERGRMTLVFFNRIRKMQPAFFLMENVPGLLYNKETKEILDSIVLKYCSDDYYLDRFVLNALDFGTPQNRERMFLIGLNKKYFIPPLKEINDNIYTMNFTIPKPIFENAKTKFPWPKMNPFGETPIKNKLIPLELCVESCLEKDDKIANSTEFFPLIKNIEQRKLIYEGDTVRHSYKRLHRYRYSPTACYGNNEVHLHPYENRRLSVREVLRIQGVPDDYILPSTISKTKKFRLIGNGVPIPLARAVANSLYLFLKSNCKYDIDNDVP
ncbi:DNA (cytosine-5)-methyltransferase 1 [Parabacteroides sp. PF5-5]|uniref:DNA cytosine methyltransferase n=1 Tax=unclassified Parabacteroides TaxID=2649774 RepID=UPI002476205A|nr:MULTISPECIES: DNA cytosine methyltransferase [unclassified Parabacteroides]MDH6304842.1 DNA (cytosine-5)-methyltransferase 1 [Parabacteroides sp. PH5-39]MDH6316072.1 DNA (cytosine-5)-methyltransferase 1 [Parabacteroides sp. PF5-13]MDH6319729.1 DNA (cytosine-5)-methyltransferase 1 [Parabacteroides sp. PH5-13]MDH6323460.1 DNA (cytosine-5)-methyltransferase 1 [Parabacteroides sp. PH5-8]MDH6327032.1 DNA (cytosine-5)-methyltransferase 1 [Parabacteroides sp. PH5-41]